MDGVSGHSGSTGFSGLLPFRLRGDRNLEPFVHRYVWAGAETNPGQVAVVDDKGRETSYRTLWADSAAMAHRLHRLGVGPEQRVAVWMSRSVEWVTAILAVLEAGGVYVPIDTSSPDERVLTLIELVGARILVTDRDPPSSIARSVECVVRVEGAVEPTATADTPAPPTRDLKPENLAYVVFTSGSTGTPKGVAMPHAGLTRLIRWQVEDGPAGLRTLQFTPTGFDVVFQEVFSTLCTGGTLNLIPDSIRRVPDQLVMFIETRRIQRLFLPYVALQAMAEAANRCQVSLPHLEHVITAGERLLITNAIAEFFTAHPDCRLDNHYGPSEAHLVTSLTMNSSVKDWARVPAIGTPVNGVRIYCLDDNLAPVPSGNQGALYVGGVGVARGYLDRPALTARRFIPDPFCTTPGSVMYHTGDLGRVTEDGTVHFTAREDDQIKVRGYRVEPGEVERVLANCAHVKQAAVALCTLAPSVRGLVAFVVTDGVGTTSAELSGAMHTSLPEYMVPSRFVFLDSLPMTSSGKVARSHLCDLQGILSRTEGEHVPAAGGPMNGSLGDTVVRIFERVLGHDEFEPEDDFFDVGGDSLLASWVVAELAQVLERPVTLSVFLQESTLSGLVRTLKSHGGERISTNASELMTLRTGPSNRALYLVHPLGGELIAYRELVRVMRAPVRVLGLAWRPSASTQSALPSLATIASEHVDHICAVQPTGPYLLAGWSFGGVLAFEIAQQLRARHATVSFLGLLDANPVLDPTTGIPTRDAGLFNEVSDLLTTLEDQLAVSGGAQDLTDLLGSRVRNLLGTIPTGVTLGHLRDILRTTRAGISAAMRYQPRVYDGSVCHFQAQQTPPERRAALASALERYVPSGLDTKVVPGDHHTMLSRDFVATMASALDDAILEVIR